MTRKYNPDGSLLFEMPHRAGKQHGFERTFNKFGRVIEEQYFVRGVEVPDWVYLDPKEITPEEIQDEDNEELRAIMMELQGPELYQIRSMARGMKAVTRARLVKESAPVGDEVLSVKRPTLED